MTAKMIHNKVVKKLNSFLYVLQQNHCSSSCNVTKLWKWDVSQIMSAQTRYAVLVLNRPITQDQEFMKFFWNNAAVRITVDGGTLRWDQFVAKLPEESQSCMKFPDLVTGDFDSITEEVLQKYRKKGCKIIHTPDQNSTDFTKALQELHTYCQQRSIVLDQVIAIGQSSGRIDQILGNIQTLYLAKTKKLLGSLTKLYLMSDDALSWLLEAGEHVINVPEELRQHGRVWCALVPIGETCESVTTRGLKWNLENATMKYGDIVSTSNTYDGSKEVKISCSHTILWSMQIPRLLEEKKS